MAGLVEGRRMLWSVARRRFDPAGRWGSWRLFGTRVRGSPGLASAFGARASWRRTTGANCTRRCRCCIQR